jgi:vacuolar protein-sorting-associated protein 4
MAPSRQEPSKLTRHFTPCSPGDAAAMEMDWTKVEGDELLEPELTVSDFVKAVQNGRKSVNDEDIAQYTEWTAEFGQEG